MKKGHIAKGIEIYFITRSKGGIYMAIVQIADFGEKNGVRTYRIHGDKEDLDKIVDQCRESDATYGGLPDIELVRHGLWTMLLQIKVHVNVT